MDGFRNPTTQELALLRRLLSQPFRGAEELRSQAEAALLSRADSRGSPAWRIQIPRTIQRAEVSHRTPAGAEWVAPDVDGCMVHFVVHVVDGYLDEVEVFREDGGPLNRLPQVSELRAAHPPE